MAEAEELLSDAARHATVFIRELWRRQRPPGTRSPAPALRDFRERLDLLISATWGQSYPLRPAQPPARATLLSILFRCDRKPRRTGPVPATDGRNIWLPPTVDAGDQSEAASLYRAMALQQVVRARRGSAEGSAGLSPLGADLYLLLEARAAERELIGQLPGLAASLQGLRIRAARQRPAVASFPPLRQPLERLYQQLLQEPLLPESGLPEPCGTVDRVLPLTASPEESRRVSERLLAAMLPDCGRAAQLGPSPLLKDCWTGELRSVGPQALAWDCAPDEDAPPGEAAPPRSARLNRRPEVRESRPGEEDSDSEAPWMIQLDEPHPHAEDPMGLQRPTDRDQEDSAEQYGDLVSELAQARLISSPGRPREVLLADDPPDARARRELRARIREGRGIAYPEWDYRREAYREEGAVVRLLTPDRGSREWVEATLEQHRAMLGEIRRRFEMLRAKPAWERKRPDGEEIDIDGYTEARADFLAGGSLGEGFYCSRRQADRNLAITLLVDVSGSTDSWVAANRRIIDVEREALLLVSEALEGLGEPWSVLTFSGEGPQAVTVRCIKGFGEPYRQEVSRRISALEPEHYTRAGAAIRHASVELMKKPAAHRLLLLLSDGKPNDRDDYEGRYGVEDMAQAVKEARLQGIHPFCLTIDRQAAAYLPRIFGAGHYALLPEPERLPVALLDWMRRLVSH
ncbi:nitric oxide reductase activation protein NorD [Gilvimarinus sp. F26214L]|uniref:nitric oxide reductase activation protein NorD n=1 Tax=Gilvimarinus sp. DZF01 TaxID=3461371 RepID=UPI004045BAF0